MSMGIGHFALGASGTVAMIQLLPLYIRLRIRIGQAFIILLGGAWALFPDIAKHAQRFKYINIHYWIPMGLPDLDFFINRLSAFHYSRWANLSFFHNALDLIDVNDSIVISSVLIVLMLITVSLGLIKDIRANQPTNQKSN